MQKSNAAKSGDPQKGRKIVVGFSGGVTSAEAAYLALQEYPREEVVLLWHDTKSEDEDTVRFLKESAEWLGMPITLGEELEALRAALKKHGGQ